MRALPCQQKRLSAGGADPVLGNTVGSLLSATGGILRDSNGSLLNLNGLLGGTNTNDTLLSSLGLGQLNLNVTALLPDASCPNGGLLNAALGLGDLCVGAQVITEGNIANLCVEQDGTCCCSPGEYLHYWRLAFVSFLPFQ